MTTTRHDRGRREPGHTALPPLTLTTTRQATTGRATARRVGARRATTGRVGAALRGAA